jgi:hypothetical protein
MSAPGPVEVKTRAWVASMGDMPEWRQLLAEAAIALAALLDVEVDPAKGASAIRELRQLVGLLAPTASMNPPQRPENWTRPEPQVDPIGNVIDMVQAKQRGLTG